MSTYDKKGKKPSREPYARREEGRTPFRRDDARDSEERDGAPSFFKDKRPRGEYVSDRHHTPREHDRRDDRQGPYRSRDDRDRPREGDERRRSFNPNFTRDNRPVEGRREDSREGYQRKDTYRREGGSDRSERPRRDDDRGGYRRSWDHEGGPRHGEDTRKTTPFRREGDFRRDERPRRDDDRGGYRRSWDGEAGPRRDDNREGGFRQGGGFRDNNRGGYRSEGRSDRPREGGFHKEGNFRKEGGFQKQGGFRKEGGFRSRDDNSRSGGKHAAFPRYDKENYPRFEPAKVIGAVRLNRFIANSGICSRREADDLIRAGVVSVNGQVVTELGTKVNPTDEVRFNGEVIRGEKKVYLLMNKPKGYVTSLEDPHADKTVMDLLGDACQERVYPVGRLDKNSVGVLLFTNDGELTRQLTHPSYNKKKIYQVSLDKAMTAADMQQLADGIELEDGPIFADEISYVGDNHKEIGIEIHSGRNRVVRRMFEFLGYNVQKLDRVYFAGLTKKRLKRGAWRFLTPIEVGRLKSGEYE